MYGLGARGGLPSKAEAEGGAKALDGGEGNARSDSPATAPQQHGARPEDRRSYLCDNRQLQTRAPGISYRFSKDLDDKDYVAPLAAWGSIVEGVDEGDGWLRVGNRFLPMMFQGVAILTEPGSGPPSPRQLGSELLELLGSVPEEGGDTDADVAGTLGGSPERRRYLCDNSRLKAAADGITFRFSKDLQDRDLVGPLAPWGSVVEGFDEGDGWIRVGDRFLPLTFHGVPVLLELAGGPSSSSGAGRAGKRLPSSARARDLYDLLGVHRHASSDELQQAYKAARKACDNDGEADEDARRAVEQHVAVLDAAMRILGDPNRRWEYDRTLDPDPEDVQAAEAAAAAAAASVRRPAPPDEAEPDADCDFDFAGDGRPFRRAKGKASRVRGGRDGVRLARAQLRGKERMELAEQGGLLRHVGPLSPFGAMGVSGILAHSEVHPRLRDFVVGRAREMAVASYGLWGAEGLRYTSIGSGEMLFDLEVLERIRGAGIRVAQVCLVDPLYLQPTTAVKQALREFADWQRATAQLRRDPAAEVLVFGALEDYRDAVAPGGRAAACHICLHCSRGTDDPPWQASLEDARQLGLQALAPGGVLLAAVGAGPAASVGAWARSGTGGGEPATLEAISDPMLAACSATLAEPSTQAWLAAQALAREEARERQRRADLEAEAERRARERTDAERAAQHQMLIRRKVQLHEHPLARVGDSTWVPTKRWRCDGCGKSSFTDERMARYRCPRGCDLDLCGECYGPEAQALAEAEAEAAAAAQAVAARQAGGSGGGGGQEQLSRAQLRARERLLARQRSGQEVSGAVAHALAGAAAETKFEATAATAPPPRTGAPRAPDRRKLVLPPPTEPPPPDMELRRAAEAKGLTVWRVAHKPHVAVRAKPKNTARTVCLLYPGEEVAVAETDGPWLRIARGPARADLASEAWVLGDASDMGLGRLLERIS